MGIVSHGLVSPTGAPLVGQSVRVALHAGSTGGFLTGGDSEILGSWLLHTDSVGVWSADFIANVDISPEGSYYTVNQTGETLAFVVPSGAGPFDLLSLLVVAPEAPSGLQVGDPVGTAAALVDTETARALNVEGDLTARAEAVEAAITPAMPAISITALPTHLNNHLEYNAVSIIRDNVVTLANGRQFAAWWDNRGHPIVGSRVLPDGAWSTFDLASVTGNPLASPVVVDGHNNLSIGVDSAGYVHVSGNHHAVPLNYVRSVNPYDITSWTVPGMVGAQEDLVTYPQFVNLPNGAFLFFYRNGISGDGDLYLNRFNTTTKAWTRVSMPLQGTGLTPAESPYNTQPMVGADGTLALFVTYRATSGASGNHDIGYIKSVDAGVTWTDVAGTPLTLPIKSTATVSGGTGSTLPLAWVGTNLINSSGAALDTLGRPHTAIWLASGGMNLHHIWWNGAAWQDDTVLTLTTQQAGTTDVTQISRVAVVCTNDGRTLLIYRVTIGDPTGLWVRDVTPLADGITTLPAFRLADVDLGGFEPTYDYNAIRTLNQLHILITPVYRAGIPVTTGIAAYTGQWGAILSVDLAQVGLIASGVLSPPTVTRTGRTSIGVSSSTAVPADVAAPAVSPDPTHVLLTRISGSATAGGGVLSARQRPATGAQFDLTQLAVGPGSASTTIAVGSNGTRAASFNGSGTLNVAATAGFASAGSLLVIVGNASATDVGPVIVTYTGVTSTTFTGCSTAMEGQADNVQWLTGNIVKQSTVAVSPWMPVRPDLGDTSGGVRVLPRVAASGGSSLVADSATAELATFGLPGRPMFYTAPRGINPARMGNCAYWKISALGLANGTAVSLVADSGSAANALTQASGVLQPTFNTTGINGKPALSFAGGQTLDGIASALGVRGFTIIAVAASTATPAGNQVVIASDDSGATSTRIVEVRYDALAATISGFGFDSPASAVFATTPTLSPSAATPRVITFQRSPGIAQTWINGTLAAQTTTSSSVPNGGIGALHVGGRFTGGGASRTDYLTGFIGDMIVSFGEPLSWAERKAAESLIASTYGISLP